MPLSGSQFQPMSVSKYGLPKSDPGASFGDQTPSVDTSSIFYGSSKDKATSWRVNRSAGSTPNAAYAGKGAISFDDNQGYQPLEVK